MSSFTNMPQGIKGGLESIGFSPEIKSLDYFQDDYGLEAAGGVEDDSEELEDEVEEDGTESNDDHDD